MKSHGQTIDVTTLVLYEFRQGVHFQAWLHRNDKRKGYPAAEAAAMLARLEENLALGIFNVRPVDWTAVHELAGKLAATYTTANGARGFDLLHVATAVQLKAPVFLTFDEGQRKVARSCKLAVAPSQTYS